MDTVRLSYLQDNTMARPGLTPTHGLAVLIETPDRRILFDAGADGSTVDNAKAMGIDVTELDGIVLSHGHWDHVGGLERVLEVAGETPVYAHPALLVPAYSMDGPQPRFIGAPLDAAQYSDRGALWRYSEEPVRLGQYIVTSGSMQMPDPPPPGQDRFARRSSEGFARDRFVDEQGLVILAEDGATLLCGCAHVGALTMVSKALSLPEARSVTTVMGGLHLGSHTDEAVTRLAESLWTFGVRQLGPCHCTGAKAIGLLARVWHGEFLAVGAGSVLERAVAGGDWAQSGSAGV